MIRFLFAPFRWAAAASGVAPVVVAQAVWVHPASCRTVRVFPLRVRPIQVLSGHVSLNTGPVLLLESGDFILLEDGDFLLLEINNA